jgi:hypothetical protein
MSALLIAIAGYIVVDRLVTVGYAVAGKEIPTTTAGVVLSVLTGAFIVTVLAVAAYGGVTP